MEFQCLDFCSDTYWAFFLDFQRAWDLISLGKLCQGLVIFNASYISFLHSYMFMAFNFSFEKRDLVGPILQNHIIPAWKNVNINYLPKHLISFKMKSETLNYISI